MLRNALKFGVALAVLTATGQAAYAIGIGSVTEVVNAAFRTPPGEEETPAKVNDTVVSDETLRTEEGSSIAVKFVDGSELSIDAGSEVVLSDYVFDAQNAASTGTIELNNGLFHFNSNSTADSGISLETPVATIGIRGTEFLVTVADEVTVVDILDGAVEVKPRDGGKPITCEGGQSILVAGSRSDAICGDLGAFSTAAGVPPSATVVASGEASDRNPSSGPGKPSDPPDAGPDPDPDPEPDPDPDTSGPHSGKGDGTNPGKGHGNGGVGNGNGQGHDNGAGHGGTDNHGGSQ